ncbi:MAG: potassium/proton antiporter [Acidimicrobiia bacterium]
MSSEFAVDAGLLLAGCLIVVGSVASGLASRFSVPSLLLFLGLGMVVGDDVLGLVRFDDVSLAQNIAIVALVVILFEGGLGTEPQAFRAVGVPAGLLATVGVVVTAGVVALAAWVLLGLPGETALLLGSVVASTDAAAVFAALRDSPLPLRTQRLLQLESGMNDPVAVLLTVGTVEVWRGDPGAGDWAWFLAVQLVAGAVIGLVVGVAGQLLVDRLRGRAVSSLGVVTLGIAAVSYGATTAVGGSGFLAVYLTGVMIARARRRTRGVLQFHEGLASTAQGVLFLLLGILVFPSQLLDDLGRALVLTLVLAMVARPAAVFAVLTWFRIPVRRMLLISWAGLRGAVPVVLATIPLTAGHPDGSLVFDVVFVVVFISVALQGPTIGPLVHRLGIVPDEPRTVEPELVPIEALDADLVEVTVPAGSTLSTVPLRECPPPSGARVVFVRRADESLVPDGETYLAPQDVLLVIASRRCSLEDLDRWSRGGASSDRV